MKSISRLSMRPMRNSSLLWTRIFWSLRKELLTLMMICKISNLRMLSRLMESKFLDRNLLGSKPRRRTRINWLVGSQLKISLSFSMIRSRGIICLVNPRKISKKRSNINRWMRMRMRMRWMNRKNKRISRKNRRSKKLMINRNKLKKRIIRNKRK